MTKKLFHTERLLDQGKVFRNPETGEEWAYTFEQAFPKIETVSVSVHEEGPGNEGLGVRVFHKRSVREYINCSNPDCSGKGYRLGDRFRQMLDEDQLSCRDVKLCSGTIESTTQACPNQFQIDLHLQLRKNL